VSSEEGTKTVSLGSRIVATILVIVFWFAFIVLYLAFYAGGLDWWQRAAVFLASGAIAIGLVAVFWVRWAVH
jgi:Trk-type K+ transport system membrane component